MQLSKLDELINLLTRGFCKDAEARDANGEPVFFDDPKAKSFDLRGALARVLGLNTTWSQSQSLCANITGRPAFDRDTAFAYLADWSDQASVTKAVVLNALAEWRLKMVSGNDARRKVREQNA